LAALSATDLNSAPVQAFTVVGAASTAASPCVDVNIGRSRTYRAEEDTGSDKRLISSVRFDEAKKPADIGKDNKCAGVAIAVT
jgi:hypothetical protein